MSSISSVTSAPNPYQVPSQSKFGQFQQDFQALGAALQSGSPTSAQSALAAFQKDLQSNSQASATQPFGKNSQANTDFQNLVSAVQSGDVKGAQQAFSSLQTDLKAAHKGHHHHSISASGTAAATPPASTSSAIDKDGDHDGSGLNVTA